MKISGKIFLVYYSGEQFVNDLLTGLFFPYRNLCALLPVPLRVFLGETIKNPDNHLGISSFLPPRIASFFPFLSKKKVLFLLAVFCILLFCFLICPCSLLPSPTRACGPSSLPLSLTLNAITLETSGKFPDVNKNINPFASLLLVSSLLYYTSPTHPPAS